MSAYDGFTGGVKPLEAAQVSNTVNIGVKACILLYSSGN